MSITTKTKKSSRQRIEDKIKEALLESKVGMKYKSLLNSISNNNLDKIVNELKALHSGRKLRSLHTKAKKMISPNDLQDAILLDASYRSRCVEIINDLSYMQRMMETMADTAWHYITTTYADELHELGKTVAERQSVIRNFLSVGYAKVEEISTILDMAKELVNDIDQSGWAIKNLIEIMQILVSREHVVKQL